MKLSAFLVAVTLAIASLAGAGGGLPTPPEKRVKMVHGKTMGVPQKILDSYSPASPMILPADPNEDGITDCGVLYAVEPSTGRIAVLVFDDGTKDRWGELEYYVILEADQKTVVEWAGTPEPCKPKGVPT